MMKILFEFLTFSKLVGLLLTVAFMRVLKGLKYKTKPNTSKLELRFKRSLKTENTFLNYIQEVLKE